MHQLVLRKSLTLELPHVEKIHMQRNLMLSSLCLMLVLKYHRQEKLPHQGVRFIIDERTQHQMSGINHVLMDPDAFHEEEFTSCCLYSACLPFIRCLCVEMIRIFLNYSILGCFQ